MRPQLLMGTLTLALMGLLTWWWLRRSPFRAYRLPTGDPGRSRWTPEQEEILEAIVAAAPTKEGDLQQALEAAYDGDPVRAARIFRHLREEGGVCWVAARHCDNGTGHPYRAGLVQVAEALPADERPWTLLARARIALGRGAPHQAEAILDELPPDLPEACEIRALVYATRDDRTRARAALFAAIDGARGIVRNRREERLRRWTEGILPP